MLRKKWLLGMAALALAVMVSGCASQAAGALMGPGQFYSGTAAMEKRGEESNTIVLWMFGKGWPTAEKVAKDNGITKIATVEHYSRPGVLYLWTRYTTIVTGE
jgi:ABC-type glycerol-3-phosphate transport system substrate-binding protein